MSILIKGMEMPKDNAIAVIIHPDGTAYRLKCSLGLCTKYLADCEATPVPPHGDLIDRDALIKAGWLNLHKEVMRMGGYAIYELPLKNPSIPVIIEAEGEE